MKAYVYVFQQIYTVCMENIKLIFRTVLPAATPVSAPSVPNAAAIVLVVPISPRAGRFAAAVPIVPRAANPASVPNAPRAGATATVAPRPPAVPISLVSLDA